MSYLILGFSILIILLMIFSKNVFYRYYNEINLKIKKRMDTMLKLTKVAPVIVLIIIFILTLTYFKTKLNIRLSHAWLVFNFWICTMIFYYIIVEIARIRKLVIILPASRMIISMFVVIYLTSYYINYIISGKEIKKWYFLSLQICEIMLIETGGVTLISKLIN